MAEQEQVAGIGLGLSLDTAGFSAGIARAKAELSGLEGTPVRVRAEVAVPREAIKVPVTPVFGVGREELAGFRAQIEQGLKSANAQIPISIKLARVNYTALREEIAAGIGTVPIKVSVSAGKSSPTSLIAATVAESQDESSASATSFVKNAARRRGLEPRRMGGSVMPGGRYLVGEDGPEELQMHARGGYIRPMRRPMWSGGRARAYAATLENEGGTFGPGGVQPSRGYAVATGSGTAFRVAADDRVGFIRAYRSVARSGSPNVGTWLHEGQIDVDPAEVVNRKREANLLARRKAQIAFFDLKRFEEIATDRRRGDPSPGQMPLFGTGRETGGPVKRRYIVRDPDGIHGRPSQYLAGLMEGLDVHLAARNLADRDRASFEGPGNRTLDWYHLNARKGHGIEVTATGGDARRAHARIKGILGFDPYADQNRTYNPADRESGFADFDPSIGAAYRRNFHQLKKLETGGEAGVGERGLAHFNATATNEDRDFAGNLRRAHGRLQPRHMEGGREWYTANGAWGRAKSREYGLDEKTGIGILAALSAGTEWGANKTKFLRVLQAHKAGQPFPYDLNFDAHVKAKAILEGMDPEVAFAGSPKIGQFNRGLLGDLNTLTIDRWALRTATNEKLDKVSKGPVRSEIEKAWRQVAAEHNLPPAVSQAALWLLQQEETLHQRALDKNLEQQAPGQIGLGFATGGFAHASEASALKRLREITSPSGAILPGFTDEAQQINLQVERMRMANRNAVESPWVRRMREQGTVAKEFRARGGFSIRNGFAVARDPAAERRSHRAWLRQSNQPRDAIGRYLSPYSQDAWYDREGYNDPDFISLIHHEPAPHRMRSEDEAHWMGMASGGRVGRYIVGERGPELFVPKRMERLIPQDVMARLPKRDQGGIVEIGKKPFSEWSPPEDGWVIPNHLRNRIPGRAPGGPVSPGQIGLGLDQVPLGGGAEWSGLNARILPRQASSAPVEVKLVGIDDKAAQALGTSGNTHGGTGNRYVFHRPEDVDAAEVESPRDRKARERVLAAADRARLREPLIQEVPPWEPTTALHAGSNALRSAPGRASLISGRSSVRSAFANLGSFFLGGREASEQARMQETIERQTLRQYETRGGQLQRQQIRSTSRLQDLQDRAETHPPRSARGRAELDRQIALATRAQERDTLALHEHEAATQKQTKIAEEASKRAQPGGKNVAQNLFGIAAGVGGYQIAQKGIDLAIDSALPIAEKWIDMWTGFRSTASRVTTDIASQTEALHGNADAALGAAAAQGNLSQASLDYVSANLKATVGVKAGAQAAEQASDLFRAAYGASQGGKAPEGLYGGYGGVLGTSLLAGQLGGGKGFTETAYGDLEAISSKNQPPDFVSNFNNGLAFATDTGLRNTVLGAAKKQDNPLGTLGDAAGLFGDITRLDVGAVGARFAGGGAPAALTGPSGAFDAQAGLSEPQVQAVTARMNELTADAKRGAAAVGDSLKNVTYGFATSQKELDDAAAAAAAAGDLKGYAGIEQTGVIARVNGQAVTTGDQYQKVTAQTATGAGITDVATLAPAVAQQLRASRALNAANVGFQNNVQIPAQLGLGLLANPLINPAAGVLPSGGVGAAGLTGGAAGDVSASLGRARQLQGQLNAEADAGLKIAEQTVKANGGNVAEYDKQITAVKGLGTEIAGIQSSIDFTQSTLSAKEFNNQMYFINRNLSDAKGLAGEISGPNNLGALQRQSFLIGRQQTSLGLDLQQRQITTNVALAGFQAPGESPEERYARREEAQIQARIQQRQLGLSRAQFGVQGQIFNVSAQRGVGDASRAKEIAQSEHNAAVEIAAKGKELAAAQALEQVALAKAQNILGGAANNFSSELEAAAGLMAQVPGSTLNQAMGAIDKVLNGTNGPGAVFSRWLASINIPGIGGPTTGATGTGTGAGGAPGAGGSGIHVVGGVGSSGGINVVGGVGSSTGHAAGILGMTAGPTHMYIGEAGRETVAILRNPRMAQMGLGGGGPHVTIMVTGNTFASPGDDRKLVQQIEAAVMSAMARKGQLLGLRGPSN